MGSKLGLLLVCAVALTTTTVNCGDSAHYTAVNPESKPEDVLKIAADPKSIPGARAAALLKMASSQYNLCIPIAESIALGEHGESELLREIALIALLTIVDDGEDQSDLLATLMQADQPRLLRMRAAQFAGRMGISTLEDKLEALMSDVDPLIAGSATIGYAYLLTKLGKVLPPELKSLVSTTEDLLYTGELSDTDIKSVAGSYFDVYSFRALAGTQASISLSSSDFPTYLIVTTPLGARLESYNGADLAELAISADSDGEFLVFVTAYGGMTGKYTLEIKFDQ